MVSRDVRDELAQRRLVAIIRGADAAACVRTAEVLVELGVLVLELSLTSEGGLDTLRRVCRSVGGSALVGAGTVLSAEQAVAAKEAGAVFAVTPALCEGATESIRLGLPTLVGAMTPTEILAAHRAGATAAKVFPARQIGGPGYFAALRGPFPDLPLIPVGGVGLADVPGYLAAGALAVGVGSPLVRDAPDGGDLGSLRGRAAEFLTEVGRS